MRSTFKTGNVKSTAYACPMIDIIQYIIEAHVRFNQGISLKTQKYITDLTEDIRYISDKNRLAKHLMYDVYLDELDNVHLSKRQRDALYDRIYDGVIRHRYLSFYAAGRLKSLLYNEWQEATFEMFMTELDAIMDEFYHSF